MTDVLAWFFGAVAVVSFCWAVWCSIQLHRASTRAKRALRALLADEGVSDDFKRIALRMNMFMRWLPVRVPPMQPIPDDFDRRAWQHAHREGLISDEGYAAVREKHGWLADEPR